MSVFNSLNLVTNSFLKPVNMTPNEQKLKDSIEIPTICYI